MFGELQSAVRGSALSAQIPSQQSRQPALKLLTLVLQDWICIRCAAYSVLYRVAKPRAQNPCMYESYVHRIRTTGVNGRRSLSRPHAPPPTPPRPNSANKPKPAKIAADVPGTPAPNSTLQHHYVNFTILKPRSRGRSGQL